MHSRKSIVAASSLSELINDIAEGQAVLFYDDVAIDQAAEQVCNTYIKRKFKKIGNKIYQNLPKLWISRQPFLLQSYAYAYSKKLNQRIREKIDEV